MTKREIYNELLRIRTQIRTEDRKKGEELIDALMDRLIDDMEEEKNQPYTYGSVNSKPYGSIGGEMVKRMIISALKE